MVMFRYSCISVKTQLVIDRMCIHKDQIALISLTLTFGASDL